MKVQVGDVVEHKSGNYYKVRQDGTYINFKTNMTQETAERHIKENEILAVYRKVSFK